MSSIINASTSGAGGLITTPDSSGVLALQGAGNTGISISATGVPTVPNGIIFPDGFTQSLSGMKKLAADQTFSAQSAVSFTGIPTNIQSARLNLDLTVGTNNVQVYLRIYDGTGTLKSGASDYQVTTWSWATNGGYGVSSSGGSSIVILTPGNISNNAAWGYRGIVDVQTMQVSGSRSTMFDFSCLYLDQSSGYAIGAKGNGQGPAVGCTGFQIFASSGTISGRISLEGLVG